MPRVAKADVAEASLIRNELQGVAEDEAALYHVGQIPRGSGRADGGRRRRGHRGVLLQPLCGPLPAAEDGPRWIGQFGGRSSGVVDGGDGHRSPAHLARISRVAGSRRGRLSSAVVVARHATMPPTLPRSPSATSISPGGPILAFFWDLASIDEEKRLAAEGEGGGEVEDTARAGWPMLALALDDLSG